MVEDPDANFNYTRCEVRYGCFSGFGTAVITFLVIKPALARVGLRASVLLSRYGVFGAA